MVDASRFFHGAKVALTFQGRELSEEEQQILVTILSKKSQLDISFIHGTDTDHDKIFISPEQSNIEKSTNVWDEGKVRF